MAIRSGAIPGGSRQRAFASLHRVLRCTPLAPLPPSPLPHRASAWRPPSGRVIVGLVVCVLATCALAACGDAETRYHIVVFSRSDRVAAQAGSAAHVDENVVAPVGLRVLPVGLRTANQGTGTLTYHSRDGEPLPHGAPLAVRVPLPAGMDPSAISRPTGMVYNGSGSLMIESGDRRGSAEVLLATLEGTIVGYNASVSRDSAVIAVDRSADGASYRGLAIAQLLGGIRLYATNFAAGRIETFDDELLPEEGLGESAFASQQLPPGLSPFGIRRIEGTLYVSYAERDAATNEPVPGAGKGFIHAFGLDGRPRGPIASGAPLNAPWGMAYAPLSMPYYGGLLIVANHGDGLIHAFEPRGGGLVASFVDVDERPLVIEGLWDVSFGLNYSDRSSVYFTAAGEAPGDGVVGRLDPDLIRTDPPSGQ